MTSATYPQSVRAEGIEKAFGKRKVLRNISFEVRPGEVVGLLGPNGAGKTTSFYMVCGLAMPDRGRILLDGHDITALPMHQRGRLGIGYLPQEASVFRGLTAAQNILAILEFSEPNRRRRAARLAQLLDDFQIAHLADAPAPSLSGGERRRVEIARALAANPRYILLDEPFAGVDPIAVADIRDLVVALKNRDIGVLITDHNVRDTLAAVDRAAIVFEGEIISEGRPDEIIADARVREVYLGDQFSGDTISR